MLRKTKPAVKKASGIAKPAIRKPKPGSREAIIKALLEAEKKPLDW